MMMTWLGNVNRYNAQGNALVRKFYMCTETVRISLFKSYCSSLYTSSLWCNYRSESLRKLCVAYNNVFRKITFLPRDCSASLMFATRDLTTCNILIRKHAYIFMKSAAESHNVILHSIERSDSLFTSPLWQHWRNLLYVHQTCQVSRNFRESPESEKCCSQGPAISAWRCQNDDYVVITFAETVYLVVGEMAPLA